MLKKGQTVIIDNPDFIIDSPNPKIANQAKHIMNRIGIYIGEETPGMTYYKHQILVGKQTYNLYKHEFSPI